MISHKLNEIAAVADEITILRDGRTIETIDVGASGVDEDRIIRGMVGRVLEHRFPERTSTIGEVFFEVRGWTVQHPLAPERLVAKGSSFTVRRGEVVGFAGLMGAGRTELAMSIFGRSYGTYVSGEIIKDGKALKLRSVDDAIDAGLAYVSEDRKALGLNLLDDVKGSIVSAKLDKISSFGVVDTVAEHNVAEGYRTSLRIKAPECRRRRRHALRRQPAEGRAGEVDVHRSRPAHPRRADARHRRGCEDEIYGIIRDLAAQGKGDRRSSPPSCRSYWESPTGSTRSSRAP